MAYLFDFGLDKNVWIPKSQCEIEKDDSGGCVVTMGEHTLIDKGLENLVWYSVVEAFKKQILFIHFLLDHGMKA